MPQFDPDRLTGVEIECVGIPQGWSRLSDELGAIIPVHVVRDGSINEHPRYQTGAEIRIGPVPAGLLLERLPAVCEILRKLGASVNTSCGLHIHHDMCGIRTRRERTRIMNNLRRFYALHQPTINHLLRQHRHNNNYCMPLTLQAVREWDSPYSPDRYVVVNGITIHGTVEFRQHSGSVSVPVIGNWIVLTQLMLHWATQAKRPRFRLSSDPWRAFWRALMVSNDEAGRAAHRYYLHRARYLAKCERREMPKFSRKGKKDVWDSR